MDDVDVQESPRPRPRSINSSPALTPIDIDDANLQQIADTEKQPLLSITRPRAPSGAPAVVIPIRATNATPLPPSMYQISIQEIKEGVSLACRMLTVTNFTDFVYHNVGIFLGAVLVVIVLVLLWAFDSSWHALSWEGWLTLGTIAALVLILLKELVPPAVVVMLADLTLLTCGVITVDQTFSGFGNSTVATIAIMLVVSEGVKETRALDLVGRYFLPTGRNAQRLWCVQSRFLTPCAVLSAFLNNTPCVAMNIPVGLNYCKTTGIWWLSPLKLILIHKSPSKIMMPLSFVVIVGGLITLVGTSTNLVVSGYLEDYGIYLNTFEIGEVGIPLAVLTILFVCLFSWLLPNRIPTADTKQQSTNDYCVSIRVLPSSITIGNTLQRAGLTSLSGLRLFGLRRGGVVQDPEPDLVIRSEDILYYVGSLISVKNVILIDGFTPYEHKPISGVPDGKLVLMEAILSPHCEFIGKTLRDISFRTKLSASVIAICRREVLFTDPICEIPLESGDILCVIAPDTFHKCRDPAFLQILPTPGYALFSFSMWKVVASLIFLLVPVCVAASGVASLALTGLFGVFALFLSKIITIRQGVQGMLLITIAGAFALSDAMDSTGVAATIANSLISVFGPWGDIGLLLAIYFPTVALTNVLANQPVVAIMFPIVWNVIEATGLSYKAASYVLMISASSCFILPVGYQTNLMVMGPGNYSIFDFVKFGTPLTLLLGIGTVGIPWLIWCS